MDDRSRDDTAVGSFFSAVDRLTHHQLVALGRAHGAVRPLQLETDPDFLAAVAEGHWTTRHDDLALHVQRCAQARAAALRGWSGLAHRRCLAAVLSGAALAVASDADPHAALPAGLRNRLAAAWTTALGDLPGCRTAVAA